MNIEFPHLIILDCLSDMETELKFFLSDEREAIFNIDFMGVSSEDLCLALGDMIFSGWVYKVRAPHSEEASVYGLTELGGRAWEHYFSPDWDAFILDECSFVDEIHERCNFECANRKVFDEIMECLFRNRLEDIEHEEIYPWYPLYWKELGSGYRISYIRGSQLDCIEIERLAGRWKASIQEAERKEAF
ncbi:MAG: hypothetical protein LAT61_12530 [Alcanivorax sp.]|nr:hypothetical protein [Alcanivorax sp.]